MMACDDARRALRTGANDEALDHLRSCDACQETFVTDTLRMPLDVSVPADFAAGVMVSLPARIEPTHGGRIWLALVAAVVLVAGAAGAAIMRPDDLLQRFGVRELAFFSILTGVELAGLILWIGRGNRI